ncbi:hypothetical protein LEP1GSC170_2936 [Leptospira interrogans serovar Bataviae str. HAI135]|nr:hypothetical protein LEP1GSC170_2936 [Leptospira interrogans serovar Bataviae str. HAI135]
MQKHIRIFYFIISILFLNSEIIFSKDNEIKSKETKKEIQAVPKKNKELKAEKEIHSDSKKEAKEKKKKQVKKENTEFEIIQKKESLFSFSIQTRKFAQGELLLLKLIPEKTILSKLDRIKIFWEKKEIPYTKKFSFLRLDSDFTRV